MASSCQTRWNCPSSLGSKPPRKTWVWSVMVMSTRVPSPDRKDAYLLDPYWFLNKKFPHFKFSKKPFNLTLELPVHHWPDLDPRTRLQPCVSRNKISCPIFSNCSQQFWNWEEGWVSPCKRQTIRQLGTIGGTWTEETLLRMRLTWMVLVVLMMALILVMNWMWQLGVLARVEDQLLEQVLDLVLPTRILCLDICHVWEEHCLQYWDWSCFSEQKSWKTVWSRCWSDLVGECWWCPPVSPDQVRAGCWGRHSGPCR